jgi:hypothetical protein
MTRQPDEKSTSVSSQNAGHSTGDYSATKAPENRPHVESTARASDPAQRPGGAHGATANVGMEALYDEVQPVVPGSSE